jgi:RNA polymerase sigma factor (sigma-70 family)
MNAHGTRPQTAGLNSPVAAADRRFKRLLKFLRRKVRSREDAEDLIQEAMLRLSMYGRTARVMNEEAFLRHSVTNLSIDQHRRDRWDPLKQVPIEEFSAHAPLISTQPTPEEVLDNEQRLKRVRAALDAVSPLTREIFLAHRTGYSYAEIAHHLNISHITIKRHVARALLAIMEYRDDATLPFQQ